MRDTKREWVQDDELVENFGKISPHFGIIFMVFVGKIRKVVESFI